MQIYLLRVLLWETSIRCTSFFPNPTWCVWVCMCVCRGGIIDPQNVLNDLRVSISSATLMRLLKGKACKGEKQKRKGSVSIVAEKYKSGWKITTKGVDECTSIINSQELCNFIGINSTAPHMTNRGWF